MRPVALADLWRACVPWDHLKPASVGGAVTAGHWEALRFVAVVAACVGEGVHGASVG